MGNLGACGRPRGSHRPENGLGVLAEIVLGEKFASNADLDGLCGDLEGGGKIGAWSLETVQGVLDIGVFHLLPSLRNQVGIEGQFINFASSCPSAIS